MTESPETVPQTTSSGINDKGGNKWQQNKEERRTHRAQKDRRRDRLPWNRSCAAAPGRARAARGSCSERKSSLCFFICHHLCTYALFQDNLPPRIQLFVRMCVQIDTLRLPFILRSAAAFPLLLFADLVSTLLSTRRALRAA